MAEQESNIIDLQKTVKQRRGKKVVGGIGPSFQETGKQQDQHGVSSNEARTQQKRGRPFWKRTG